MKKRYDALNLCANIPRWLEEHAPTNSLNSLIACNRRYVLPFRFVTQRLATCRILSVIFPVEPAFSIFKLDKINQW